MASILVIEDDDQLREVIRKILTARGHRISLASNGMEGLRLYRTVHPDLIITDIVMPVKEGLDTIRLLRTWSPEAKIIAMSGSILSRQKDPLKTAVELGASKVLAKPFRAEQIVTAVDQCLAEEHDGSTGLNPAILTLGRSLRRAPARSPASVATEPSDTLSNTVDRSPQNSIQAGHKQGPALMPVLC